MNMIMLGIWLGPSISRRHYEFKRNSCFIIHGLLVCWWFWPWVKPSPDVVSSERFFDRAKSLSRGSTFHSDNQLMVWTYWKHMELIEDPDLHCFFLSPQRVSFNRNQITHICHLTWGCCRIIFLATFSVIANIAAPGGKYCTIFHSLMWLFRLHLILKWKSEITILYIVYSND